MNIGNKTVLHKVNIPLNSPAPFFSGENQNGKMVSLDDFKGKKLCLVFYPADMTPTCTVEVCNIRDGYEELTAMGIHVLGISPDGQAKHQKFHSRHQLPFDLIVDEDLKIIKAYDIWGLKQFMGKIYDGVHRTSVLIDENGKIFHVITQVKSKNHTQQILEAFKNYK